MFLQQEAAPQLAPRRFGGTQSVRRLSSGSYPASAEYSREWVFFAWHRHFIWLYDRALRNECGYRGPTPYWDWTLYPDDPGRSPVFDGSDSSMGGNGEYYPHGPILATGLGNFLIPAGTGGGCVKGGRFTDHTVCSTSNPSSKPLRGLAPVNETWMADFYRSRLILA